jgi:hypothetical protein
MHQYRYSVVSWKFEPVYGHGGLQTDDLQFAKRAADMSQEDNGWRGLQFGVMDRQTRKIVYKGERKC